MYKKGFTPLLIILIVTILATASYFVFRYPKITINEYTTKGYAYDVKFKTWPKLNFNYPSDWIINEEGITGGNGENPFDHVTISKNGYIVIIDQRLMAGGGGCQFKDSPIPTWPSRDLTTVEYKEMNSNLGYLRHFKVPLGEFDKPETPQNTYDFCIKNDNNYQALPVGDIFIETPSTPNEIILTEALNIVKSIKPIQN